MEQAVGPTGEFTGTSEGSCWPAMLNSYTHSLSHTHILVLVFEDFQRQNVLPSLLLQP